MREMGDGGLQVNPGRIKRAKKKKLKRKRIPPTAQMELVVK